MAKTVHDLQVFQKACEAADALFALLSTAGLRHDRDLGAQLNRASVRVVSDIAEGFEQKTDRHFARFLYDARGGTAEIRAQLSIALARGYVVEADRLRVAERYEEVGRMLSGLISYLEREDRQNRGRHDKGEPG